MSMPILIKSRYLFVSGFFFDFYLLEVFFCF